MESANRDRLDRWLDRAMQQYGSVEPRPGLEARMLANLEARQRSDGRSGTGFRWRSVIAAAVLGIGVVAAFWSRSTHRELPRHVARVTAPAHIATVSPPGTKSGSDRVPRLHPTSRVTPVQSPRQSPIVQEPRLPEFPSPRSFSEQEKMLVTCVTSYRDTAIFMAREQAEFREQGEQEMRSLLSEGNEAHTPE